jgi:hypothetical protein
MRAIFVFLLACLFLSTGCNTRAVKSEATNNRGIDLELLFTDANGYQVYRFQDCNQNHYYVVPQGEVIESIKSGKHTISDRVPTVKKK